MVFSILAFNSLIRILASLLLMPRLTLCCLNSLVPNGLVNMSINCSIFLHYSIMISLAFISSLMQWYLVSMCLVLLWNTAFFENAMVELLSHNSFVASCYSCPKSFSMLLIYTAWKATPIIAMYSTSADERDTMGCFFDALDMALEPR